jgi:hypothetical protein
MITKELADQVRAEAKQLKEAGEKFLHAYKELCALNGAGEWPRGQSEMVFHRVRKEVMPIMEQVGMDERSVQALCSWAEKLVATQ